MNNLHYGTASMGSMANPAVQVGMALACASLATLSHASHTDDDEAVGQHLVYQTYTLGEYYPSNSSVQPLPLDQQFCEVFPERNGYTAEAKSYLLTKAMVTPQNLKDLLDVIFSVFHGATTQISIYQDIEEGWEKLVIDVDSGIDNFDKIFDMEDDVFSSIEESEKLTEISKNFIISNS